MALVLSGTNIQRVGVVDDSEDTRDTISDELQDAHVETRAFDGPFGTLNELIDTVVAGVDAVICDHHLTPRNYAPCTGAEAVANWYANHFPAVLVTRWEKAEVDGIRPFRRNIPSLIPSDEANPDAIVKGLEICIEEFNGRFIPPRKPWANMFRVEEVDESAKPVQVYVVIPGWQSDEVIRLLLDLFPEPLRGHVKPEERFFAVMNLGAQTQEDLYFNDIEYRGK
jgi:CheY-like chemotaxis protein